jgi:hypothetical protein
MVRAFKKTEGIWAKKIVEWKTIVLNSVFGPRYGGKAINIMI